MKFCKLASIITILVLPNIVSAASLPIGSQFDQGYNNLSSPHNETSGLSNIIGDGADLVGVVFGPSASGELTSFSLDLNLGYAPNNGSVFTVSLYEYDDNGQTTTYSSGWTSGSMSSSPIGSALLTESFTALNYDSYYSSYSTNLNDIFNFQNSIHVESGQQYALMVHELTGGNISWSGGALSSNLGWDSLPPPSTGSLNQRKGDPVEWRYSETSQLNFATYVIADPLVEVPIPQVPVPAAVWLFGSGLIGLVGFSRRKKA